MANIPEKPTLDGIEARWADQWDLDGIYRFDRSDKLDVERIRKAQQRPAAYEL